MSLANLPACHAGDNPTFVKIMYQTVGDPLCGRAFCVQLIFDYLRRRLDVAPETPLHLNVHNGNFSRVRAAAILRYYALTAPSHLSFADGSERGRGADGDRGFNTSPLHGYISAIYDVPPELLHAVDHESGFQYPLGPDGYPGDGAHRLDEDDCYIHPKWGKLEVELEISHRRLIPSTIETLLAYADLICFVNVPETMLMPVPIVHPHPTRTLCAICLLPTDIEMCLQCRSRCSPPVWGSPGNLQFQDQDFEPASVNPGGVFGVAHVDPNIDWEEIPDVGRLHPP